MCCHEGPLDGLSQPKAQVMNLHLARLTEADAVHLSSALLELDEAECRASGREPITALSLAANEPFQAYVLRDEKGWPIMAFGARPGPRVMHVWLMATEAMHPSEVRWILRHLDKGLRFLRDGLVVERPIAVASCMVWAHNTPHIRWLLATGFRPTGHIERRINAEPFLEFTRNV